MVLSIAVLDINDNAPVFKEAEYAARINESAAAGTFVVQVRRPYQRDRYYRVVADREN
jgi:hypothetical protein